VEVVAVTYFARHGVPELRALRVPVLEVHVPDEEQRDREYQRPEEPEARWIASPVHPAAEQPQEEEHQREPELPSRVREVRIPQPLPLDVVPPHPHLRRELDLPVPQARLAELLAIDVRLESRVRHRRELALPLELRHAAGRLALVDGGEVRAADGLERE